MKPTLILLALSLALLCVSCKKAHDPDAGLPHITFVSFEGIPTSHVELDQLHQTITVKVASTLPEQGLVPTFKTSPGVEIIEGLTPEGKLDLTPFCSCYNWERNRNKPTRESELTVAYKNKMTNDQLTTTYRVILSGPENLIEPIAELPITYTVTFSMDIPFLRIQLPVKNLYRTPYVNAFFLKNLATGKKSGYYLEGPNCINSCDGPLTNRMTVVFRPGYGGGLTPGTYEVSIRTADSPELDDFIVFPQPLIYTE